MSPYQKSNSKALGKDCVLVWYEQTVIHCRAAERVDLFLRNFLSPEERIDSRLMKQRSQQAEENRYVLRQIVLAVEFLAKPTLPFRGHCDDRVHGFLSGRH